MVLVNTTFMDVFYTLYIIILCCVFIHLCIEVGDEGPFGGNVSLLYNVLTINKIFLLLH